MIETMTIEVVFTTESTATGGDRDVTVKTTRGNVDIDVSAGV